MQGVLVARGRIELPTPGLQCALAIGLIVSGRMWQRPSPPDLTATIVARRDPATVNPRIVSGRLGHSTVALTLDIYWHVMPQDDQAAADRIAALIA